MHKVEELKSGKSKICDEILRALPNWFGIEEAILNYTRDVESMPMFAIKNDQGQASAFLSLNFHNDHNAEIHVMAVIPEMHGKSLGTNLVAHAEQYARTQGRRYLTVKTLSPAKADKYYDRTRQFYESVGFSPLEEFKTLWGSHNPCLLMIKSL